MPRDVVNMPFGRSAPFRAPVDGGRAVTTREDAPLAEAGDDAAPGMETRLRAENLLLETFNHASAVAYQAKGELTNLFNLYLLAVGALATGFGVLANSYNQANKVTVTVVEMVTLAISALLSFAFYVRLFDVGHEYDEGLAVMERVTLVYLRRVAPQEPDMAAALSWRGMRRQSGGGLGGLGPGATVMSGVMALLGAFAVAGAVGQARQLAAIWTHTFADFTPEVAPLLGLRAPYFWELGAAALALLAHAGYVALARRREG